MIVHKSSTNKRHFIYKIYFRKNSSNFQYKLYRPFMSFSRFELLKFCEFWNLPTYPDFTNFNLLLLRNRLRLDCFPYWKFFFNFQFSLQIRQMQTIFDVENEYFQFILQKLFFTSHLHYTQNTFYYLPKVLQYKIFYYFYNLINKKISFNEVSNFLKTLKKSKLFLTPKDLNFKKI